MEDTINSVLDETGFDEGARDVANAYYSGESFDRRAVNGLLARGINAVYQRYAPIGGKIETTFYDEKVIWTDEYGDSVPVGSYAIVFAEDAPAETEDGGHIDEMVRQLRGYVIRETLDILERAQNESINREDYE